MRLDKYLVGNGFASRTREARAVEQGRVLVNGKRAKVSQEISSSDTVQILPEPVSFVSEGGFKLYKAFKDFAENVNGLVFADLGASTGGFTDCLLRSGASRVYAVDVGESQLDGTLREDSRVIVMDRRNARYLTARDFPQQIDGVTADLSFISLTYIFPVIADILPEGGKAFVLVKPQFECGGKGQDKHGIVKEKKIHEQIIRSLCAEAEKQGLAPLRLTNAPLRERKNTEYVLCLQKGGRAADLCDLIKAVYEPTDG